MSLFSVASAPCDRAEDQHGLHRLANGVKDHVAQCPDRIGEVAQVRYRGMLLVDRVHAGPTVVWVSMIPSSARVLSVCCTDQRLYSSLTRAHLTAGHGCGSAQESRQHRAARTRDDSAERFIDQHGDHDSCQMTDMTVI